MAPKKSKKSSTTSQPTPSTEPPPSNPLITPDVQRAITHLQRGNCSKALKLINQCIYAKSDSSFLYSIEAAIHFKNASLNDGSSSAAANTKKHKHLKNAEDSIRRAIAHTPNSISYALFLAVVLFHLAECKDDEIGYESAVQECERALSIQDPTDPLQESFELQSAHEISKENRVQKVVEELKALKKKAKRKNLGNTELVNNKIEERQKREKEAMEKLFSAGEKFGTPARKKSNSKSVVVAAKVDVIGRFKAYWNNTMTVEEKRGFLKVGIQELKAHLTKNKLAKEILVEAIDWAKENKTWKFSACWSCDERFLNVGLYLEHVHSKHTKNLPDKSHSSVPKPLVDEEGLYLVQKCVWKPVDVPAAIKILEDGSRMESCDVLERYLDECNGGLDTWKWPVCDDSERAEILERIRDMLLMLMANECFSTMHLAEVIRYPLKVLRTHTTERKIKDHGLDQTLDCVCFLEPLCLKVVLELLEEWASLCSLDSLNEDRILYGGDKGFCVKESIVFSSDLSCIVLDERLLRGELITQYHNAIEDDGNAVISSVDDDCENSELPDCDAFVDWLFLSHSIEETLKAWTIIVNETNKNNEEEFLQFFDKQFERFNFTCERKREFLEQHKVSQNFGTTCFEERKKMEQSSQSYPHNLKKELCQYDAIIMGSKAAMRQTQLNLVLVSAMDYRLAMLCMLRSFMRARLEDLVEKDAIEALLAEFSLDAEKNINKGGDNVKQIQGKSKDKKKKKDHRKVNDSKAITGGSEEQLPLQENAEQACFPSSHGVPVSIEELKQQQEEEHQRKAEELEKILKYQRQIEEEAKQKRLAEQNKNIAEGSKPVAFPIQFGSFEWPEKPKHPEP